MNPLISGHLVDDSNDRYRQLFERNVTVELAVTAMREGANRGTLFLDEIGDLELALQPTLLKVLEDQAFRRVGVVKDRQVDVRLIAATHQDLAAMVREQRFRSDLDFRISTIPVHVPALRERIEDLPVLARLLLDRVSIDIRAARNDPLGGRRRGPHGIWLAREGSGTAQRPRARGAPWSTGRHSGVGSAFRAPLVVQQPATSGLAIQGESEPLALEQMERLHIVRALEAARGNVERSAARLAVPRSTLYQKIKAMQIVVPKDGRAQ